MKPAKEDPLRAILRRIIESQEALPPVQVRLKHYSAKGESRTEMDRITDKPLALPEIETDVKEATLQYGE